MAHFAGGAVTVVPAVFGGVGVGGTAVVAIGGITTAVAGGVVVRTVTIDAWFFPHLVEALPGDIGIVGSCQGLCGQIDRIAMVGITHFMTVGAKLNLLGIGGQARVLDSEVG